MKGLGHGLPKVFLQTGDCFFGIQPTLVTTVLGSCLAITMHVPQMGVGTICHAFLPDSAEQKMGGHDPQVCRFVDTALQNMLETLDKVGVPRRDLVVKLFGGSTGITMRGVANSSYDIGRRNIEMARKLLHFARLNIEVEDVGGSQGRKLLFHTQTGEIWVKKLNKMDWKKNPALAPVLR
ncbi:chemotaxis protein CheD [Pseudodesulfovibrio piezophilus]|uniref:Probable chemoreceptor glutamine deamidase CheD n=1 Tax=Pseudodesulfovibrio piezophilus (strain DSM 21447 / JCM 15486 / C1TLV30) TaxID=1322246 RepID=M1WXK5_PSEP2|nr:chemotaxis protein CheD [Pseudodesulfovibrio piezophilus]CCH49773.1 putative chemoreceptor glutamine deamidase CheD [Pseudodesulfovibrio piezophilus C1TLV30]